MALTLNALSDHFGMEASGIDLTDSPGDGELTALRNAFSEHGVLVVREQSLSPEQMLTAVRVFGELFEQHNKRFALPECPQIHYIWNQDRYPDGRRYVPGAGYHTDHSNDRVPPKATVLHAVKLPSAGGDTQFVDMCGAYEALPEDMRSRIDPLMAVHVYQSRHSERKLVPLDAKRASEVPDEVIHPLVRTHPENGRRALYLNPIRIDRIVELEEQAERFRHERGKTLKDFYKFDPPPHG